MSKAKQERRFTKAHMGAWLAGRIANIQQEHDLDLGNGWDQIQRRAVRKNLPVDEVIKLAMEYGRLRGFEDVMEVYEIAPPE